MGEVILPASTFTRKIDITYNSALLKNERCTDIHSYLKKDINASTFRLFLQEGAKKAGDTKAVLIDWAVLISSNLIANFPVELNYAINGAKTGAEYFKHLMAELSLPSNPYPKFEVELLIRRYTTKTGKYFEYEQGGRITAKYTPTGEKISF